METSDDITPAMLAEYDQALAETSRYLDRLIAAYVGERTRNTLDGWPEPASVIACALFLLEQTSHDACASALAVAMMRLSREAPDARR